MKARSQHKNLYTFYTAKALNIKPTMKTSVEITLKSLALSGIPEKVLLRSRNMLTVEMVWPRAGAPRKSATRQITMKKGKVDFTTEPWQSASFSARI